jgi:hypothetical protein
MVSRFSPSSQADLIDVVVALRLSASILVAAELGFDGIDLLLRPQRHRANRSEVPSCPARRAYDHLHHQDLPHAVMVAAQNLKPAVCGRWLQRHARVGWPHWFVLLRLRARRRRWM